MNDYEAKKQARIDRYRALAEKAEGKSQALYDEAGKMFRSIPFGQPILVGHHSEKGDRAFRARAAKKMDKNIEEQKKADYYKEKARAAENNRAVSSDDPEAIKKLKKQLEKREQCQRIYKEGNKIVHSKPKNVLTEEKIKRLLEIKGINETTARKLFEPDFAGRIGFAGYILTNNNANIKRLKDRIAKLEKMDTEKTTEKKINGIRIVDNVEENRLQLIFNGKPPEKVRKLCKYHGFRWSPSNEAWQRHRSNQAMWKAEFICNSEDVLNWVEST